MTEEEREPGKKQRSVVVVLLVPAAILVAATLLLLRMRLEPPTVPTYVLAAQEAGGDVVLRAGDRFRLGVRPEGAVQGAVAARGFLLRGDEVRAWDPPFTVNRDGSVDLDGRVDALFAGVPPGPWDIAVVVGRPETLPTAPRDVLRAREGGPSDAAWRLVRERVVLVE